MKKEIFTVTEKDINKIDALLPDGVTAADHDETLRLAAEILEKYADAFEELAK